MRWGGVWRENVVTTSEAQYTSVDLTIFYFITLMRGLGEYVTGIHLDASVGGGGDLRLAR